MLMLQKMSRRMLAGALLILAFGSCQPSPDAVECVAPPSARLEVDSDFGLDIEPNPVMAGASATLAVSYDKPAGRFNGGLGASWECWDGNSWVQTHVIIRGWDVQPATIIDLSVDSTIAIIDVGLPVPNSHQIIIPSVNPGLYRITDYLYSDQTSLTAHEIVEVLRPSE
jgi:hypothetical protein